MWLAAGLMLGIGLGFGFIWMRNRAITLRPDEVLSGKEVKNSPEIGSAAPDFELQTLDGEKMNLSSLLGHTVLINFWATWCGPCRTEMPAIESRFEAYQDQMTILAVNFDEPEDDVQSFAKELNLTFPILLDPGAKVQDLYRVRGYPTTFLVDSQGIIQVMHIGVMSEKQLDGYLKQIGVAK